MNLVNIKKIVISAILVFGALIIFSSLFNATGKKDSEQLEFPVSGRVWRVKSIDTMKDSRDKARIKFKEQSFDLEINRQMGLISKTGATHVAVDTPYDQEFVPYLKRWVNFARQYNLKVWFRGNFSSWEGWFGYEKNLNRDGHIEKLKQFIGSNADLFEDGDIFTACPECENGGPGDPRYNTDIDGFRTFMTSERRVMDEEFAKTGKKVNTNYTSMNLDVAKLVFDKKTLSEMDNLIVVDHYTRKPEDFVDQIVELKNSTKAQIILGELGAPILHIHGEMDEEEQSRWIERVLSLISEQESIVGVNWWVGFGGESAIFSDLGEKKAQSILEKYYRIHDLNVL